MGINSYSALFCCFFSFWVLLHTSQRCQHLWLPQGTSLYLLQVIVFCAHRHKTGAPVSVSLPLLPPGLPVLTVDALAFVSLRNADIRKDRSIFRVDSFLLKYRDTLGL